MKKWLSLILIALIAGCSMEQPVDTSDPEISAKWVAYCKKKASKSEGLMKAAWLLKAYDHAEEAGTLDDSFAAIPNEVMRLSRQAKNFDGFSWALDQGAKPPVNFQDLMAYNELGPKWRDLVFEADPSTLPVFMSLAVDDFHRGFFYAHAKELAKQGFKVPSPLDTSDFKIRYRNFIGLQLENALSKQDEEKIRFLIAVTPKVENFSYADIHTMNRMRATADYVFQTLEDEELAIELLNLQWFINPVDFEQLKFGKPFRVAYQSKPEYFIHMQRLNTWEGRMSSMEARILLTMPESSWAVLDNVHFDEMTEESIKLSNNDYVKKILAYKTQQKPLTQVDYNNLANWALKHGNRTLFEYVIKESGELDIYHLDLGALAENQKLFEHYAPKLMSNVEYTTDEEPREYGTTIGRLKRVFTAQNEQAGLWLVSKYDLSDAWAEGTGGRTLLMDVCEGGNLLAARYLVEKRRAKVNAETGYSKMEVTVFGKSNATEGKLSPIFYAANSGNPALIKYLASKGANVNANSNFRTTPLMHAVSAGHYDAVKMLLSLGANVNAEMDNSLSTADLGKSGSLGSISTAYRRARSNNDQEMMRILTDAGARTN